jgi:hypothetical protein
MSNEQDKAKHGNRIHRAWTAIKRQLKIARAHGIKVEEPHRLTKHHAMDCGVPHCPMCSNPRHNATVKGAEKLTIQERRNNQKAKDD